MKRQLLTSTVLFFLVFSVSFVHLNQLKAQTLVGAQIDNRAGIRGLTLNPANVVNPRLKSELNLFTASGYFGNDYIGVNVSDLTRFNDARSAIEGSSINAKPDNNFVGNIDILGPSFQINLSPVHSIAVSTRFRGFFNLNNIGGEFIEAIFDEEQDIDQFEVLMRDLNGITHVWMEIGATYGRVLVDNDNLQLKGAATLKYLGGAGGVVTSSDQLGALYIEQLNTLTTRGVLDYGYSEGYDGEDITFGALRSGFGVDLGAIIEIKDERDRAYTDGYKFRGGISVMDIGGINYDNFTHVDYNMDNTISLDEFDDKSIQDVLDENYEGVEVINKTKLGMPTSLQIFGDFAVTNKFFVSAHGSISLTKNEGVSVSQITNNLAITPRFESGWLAVYSPVSFRQYEGGVSWGIGLRAGPVIIGSGSILTNAISSESRSTDLYFGLQIPFYNKGRRVVSQ